MTWLAVAWRLFGGFGGFLRMSLASAITAALVLAYAHWWLVPQAVRDARSGYVLEVRATAAEAKATELQRQIDAQRIVTDAYQVQYKNLLARYTLEDAESEKEIAAYEAKLKQATTPPASPQGPPMPPKCDRGLTGDDIEFLRK